MMMTKHIVMGMVVGAALLTGACKKNEDSAATPPPEPTPKVEPPRPEPPKVEPVKPLMGADLGKWYAECWNDFNTAAWDKFAGCYADDATSTWIDSGMPEAKGPQGIIEAGPKPYKAAMSDVKGDLQLVLINGRNIVGVSMITGTHTAPLKTPAGEIPATNKKVGYLVVQGVEVNEANKVTKEWFLQDMGTMMSQLGLNPMPARPVMDKGMDGAPIVVVASDSETEKKNVEAWKAQVDAFNKHDSKAMAALWSDKIVESDVVMNKDNTGKDVQAGADMFWKGFPDAKIDLTNIWAAGDYVVATEHVTGTNSGDLGKTKKTGKPIDVTVVEIARYEGGKVTNIWRFRNGMAMAQQLGMIPAPGAAPAGMPAKPGSPADKGGTPEAPGGTPGVDKPQK